MLCFQSPTTQRLSVPASNSAFELNLARVLKLVDEHVVELNRLPKRVILTEHREGEHQQEAKVQIVPLERERDVLEVDVVDECLQVVTVFVERLAGPRVVDLWIAVPEFALTWRVGLVAAIALEPAQAVAQVRLSRAVCALVRLVGLVEERLERLVVAVEDGLAVAEPPSSVGEDSLGSEFLDQIE